MEPKLKTTTSWLAALALTGLSSCSSLPDVATSALTGGTGAYLGHELTGGTPEGALLGAVSGVAAGALFNHSREKGKEKAYATGYDKGRSDEVKRLYWVQKSLHREDEFGMSLGAGSLLMPSLFEMPVPEHVASDGTVVESHTQIIEVLEP